MPEIVAYEPEPSRTPEDDYDPKEKEMACIYGPPPAFWDDEEIAVSERARCCRCQKDISPDDLYCRFCGSNETEIYRLPSPKRADYDPRTREMSILYGPPSVFYDVTFVCPQCAHSWAEDEDDLLDNDTRYCPKCGTTCIKQSDDSSYNSWKRADEDVDEEWI